MTMHRDDLQVSAFGSWFTRLTLVLMLVSGLGACATNPATGGVDFVMMSEEDEIKMGQELHPQIMTQYRAYPNPDLQEYVNDIGQKLVRNSDRPNIEYTFTVIDSDLVNAFATPGGYIYVSRGLLAYLNSEAELAAVLGHEIGHVTARHAVGQHSRGALMNVLGGIANAATGGVAGVATGAIAGAYISSYGRDKELEADREGAEYLVRSGYPSSAMIEVVKILKHQEAFEIERAAEEGREPRVYHGIFSTHPDNDTRLRKVVQEADKLTESAVFADNRDVFLSHLDGMVFGKVGAGGVITEDEFRHARFGIGMVYPSGWAIAESRGRLESSAPDRKSLLILSRQPLKETLSPLDILTKKIGLSNLQDGRTLQADGLVGYTALAPNANSPFGRGTVRYAVFTDDRYAYVFAGASQTEAIQKRNDWRMLSTIKSMRKLDGQSKRSARIPHIAVIEANAATTMATLATASPLTDYVEQQLRLLNNFYPEGEPQPGQKIKIIDSK
ncbi:MAG: M48 family metalloprotease [Gammaproteobacteria bacterium]|nr:M48 family metalloprotease [Gammaproteobacteria bacterium]